MPTPLEDLTNLSQKLGGPRILIKRDDLTGLATGGNKTRKLEFLMGEAQHQQADIVITAGGIQSNHARQTAAAARKLGMDVILVLRGERPTEINGNILLDEILGAKFRFVDPIKTDLDQEMERIAQELSSAGQRPYVIPSSGSIPLGTLGYVNAFEELIHQANQMQTKIDHLIVSGGGGTQAGLCLGAKAMNTGVNIIGISISENPHLGDEAVAKLVNETTAYMGLDLQVKTSEITVLNDYLGEAYAIPYPEMVDGIKLVAQTEGILLDPIYTGKVMAGLIDLIQKNTIKKGETVVFVHTGGIPALFATEFRKLFI